MDYSDVRVKDLDAEIQNSKAMNFYYVGKIDSAIVYLKKNIEIIDQIGNKKSSAFAKINLGSIYSSISDFSSSARYYLKAYQELADLKTLDDRRVAVLAGNLAKVYYELEKRDSSIHWAKRAMQLGKQTNNVTAQFFGNYLMGVNLSELK